MMKLCILVGTRPEIIKMSPIIRKCMEKNIDFYTLHTGQHYSPEMDKKIFEDLNIPSPKYNLNVGAQPYRKQVGLMTSDIKRILAEERPDVVIVEGDTISVLAGALAASKLKVDVAHHEAGLRSHNPYMLEETNRIITDHISEFLFAPTHEAVKNLRSERISDEKIFLVGNTVVDALCENIKIAKEKSTILEDLGLNPQDYILVTAHRAENVDIQKKLQGIIKGLELTAKEHGKKIIYPIHPRTENKLKEFGINVPDSIELIKPLGYLDFLHLQNHASLIITDSGGIQEEACTLKIPCITIRDETERPETVMYGMNMIAGTDHEKILESSKEMMNKKINWLNPFGDGKTSERIIKILYHFKEIRSITLKENDFNYNPLL